MICQIDKRYIEVFILHHTYSSPASIEQLKNHIDGSSACTESILTLRQVILLKVLQKAIQEDMG